MGQGMIGFGKENASKQANALLSAKAERPRNALRPVKESSKPYIKRSGKDGVEIGVKAKW